MARIIDYVFTEGSVAAASFSPDMPVHATNDLLLLFANADLVGFASTPSGWTELYRADHGAFGSLICYKIAASSSEAPSVSLSASDTYTCTVVTVRNINTTTPINASAQAGSQDTTVPFSGVGLNTTSNNCLVFSFLSTDGGLGPTCAPPWTNLVNGDAGANSGGLAYMVQKNSGTVAAPTWYGQLNDDTLAFCVAVNDNGSLTTLDPYIQQDTVNGIFLEPGYVVTGANAWGNTYQSSLSLTSIGSKTTAGDAAALQTDQGLNPYWGVASCTPAASTNGSTVGGPQLDFGSSVNLTNGIVLFNYFFSTPRDYIFLSTPTDSGQAGLLFVARDSSNNYKAWSIGAKNTITTKPDGYNIVGIQVDQTTNTRFASSGTLSNSSVSSILTLAQCRYGAVIFRWGNVVIAYEHAIAGGTSSNPLNFDDLDFLFNRSLGGQRIMLREGSAATILVPVKIGGTDPVHLSINLRTFQFRRQADGLDYLDWHVDNNKVGFEFDGQSGDTIKFTSCVFVSDSPYYWRFNSGHSSDAVLDFAGSTIINATITLRSTVTLDNLTFIDCSSFLLNSATISNSTFDNSKVSTSVIGELSDITNSEFISSGTGHAIEITGTAGDVTLTGLNFTDYAVSNGSTGNEAIYVNIGSGTVNISINGGDTPSIRTAGATVNVINAVTVKITVKDVNTGNPIENARVFLEKVSDGTDIFNALTNASGIVQNTAYAFTGSENVTGRVRKGTSAPLYKTSPISGTITSSGLDLTVFLIPDE